MTRHFDARQLDLARRGEAYYREIIGRRFTAVQSSLPNWQLLYIYVKTLGNINTPFVRATKPPIDEDHTVDPNHKHTQRCPLYLPHPSACLKFSILHLANFG